jgi:hypothetical protein
VARSSIGSDLDLEVTRSAPSSIFDGLTTVAAPVVRVRTGGTWDEGGGAFGADVRALAAALIGYGLPPAGRVAVLGDEGCDALQAQLAVLVSGGCLVWPDPALHDTALANALGASEIVQAIASDETQLARLLALRPDLPKLELILLMRARPSERKPAALLASAAMSAGESYLEAEPEMLRAALSSTKPSDEAAVFWRSAGAPEALTRSGLATLAGRIAEVLAPARGRSARAVVDAGSAARIAAAVAVTARNGTLLLGDALERADAGLAEHPAQAVLLSIQALNRLGQSWKDDVESRSWLSRAIAHWSLRQRSGLDQPGWKLRLAEVLTLKGIRAQLGGEVRHLDVVRHKSSRREPVTENFFEAIGLPLRYLEGDLPRASGPTIAPKA